MPTHYGYVFRQMRRILPMLSSLLYVIYQIMLIFLAEFQFVSYFLINDVPK